MFNIAAVQVASAAGVPVIDIRSAFLAQPDFRSYLCADGIHPNEAGQKLIYGAIRRQLPRRKPTSGLLRRFCFENACRPEKPRCGTSPQPERFGRFLYSEQRCQKGLDFCQRCFCSYSTICKRGSQQNLLTFPFPF